MGSAVVGTGYCRCFMLQQRDIFGQLKLYGVYLAGDGLNGGSCGSDGSSESNHRRKILVVIVR